MKKIVFLLTIFVSIQSIAQEGAKQDKNCTAYPQKKIEQVKKNILLDPEKEREIISVFEELCQKEEGQTNKSLYRIAVRRAISDMDSLYLIYKNELDPYVEKEYKRTIEEISDVYNLTEKQIQSISALVRGMTYMTGMSFYQYPEDERKRARINRKSKSEYNKRIEIALTKAGIKTSLAIYCHPILSLGKRLSLTEEQLDKILTLGYEFSWEERSNPNFQKLIEGHKALKNILDADQYELLLSYANIQKARQKAGKTWKDAVRLGISVELDSATVYPQLVSYYLEDSKIRERYRIVEDGEEEKNDKLAALKQREPKVLKKINVAKKREQASKRKDNETMIW